MDHLRFSHAFAPVHCCLVVTSGKGLTSWLLLVIFIVFCYIPTWYPGSGVVLHLSLPGICLLFNFNNNNSV